VDQEDADPFQACLVPSPAPIWPMVLRSESAICW
jgi:hypothetical protein